jgi:processive 1,2-diacylglycerol beta-glucosyltransferase
MAVPFFNVVTDSISINSLWWRAGAAGWFLPNEDSRAALLQAGVDPELVAVSGFPVPPFFADNEGRLTPPDLAAGAVPRVLYIINSGTRGSAETARRLLQETNWEVTCTVGRNAGLQTELSRLAAGRRAPATILGWTSEIPRLLMTHHVVVSKAGGATTQEALAAGCPMIVNQIVPGQEEGNYELLRRHGVGALAETPDAVLAALQRAFADEGREWRRWRLALRRIAHPTAGPEVVSAILGAMARPAGETDVPLAWPPAAATA